MQNHKHPSSSYARILFRHLRLNEKNSRAFFAGTNVSYQELMTMDGTICRESLSKIYRNALAIAKRDDLGLSLGTQMQMSAHGPLGVAMFSGPDLRTGLALLAEFGQTRTDFINIAISPHPQGIKVSYSETFDLGDLRAFITESVLIGLFSAITFFSGVGQFKGEVHFAYPKPRYGHKYFDYFGDNITFNQPATQLIVAQSMLSLPSPAADMALHQQAVAMCKQQLQAIKAQAVDSAAISTKQVVTKLLAENPGKIWSLSEVAAKLCISERTLIRRLQAEGTQFQRVRDEHAKEQAASYLSNASLSVESIGHLMGFSDTSSFRRSFKRWFGETPSQYRISGVR